MEATTQEPTQITAGDSVAWVRAVSAYPAGEGWVLHYILLSQGKEPIRLDGTAEGNSHRIDGAAADTAGWAPGIYQWTAFVTKGTDRKTLGSGQVRILPDPATAEAAFDPRSENQKILDAINAVLAGELTNPLAEYKIAGREAKRHSRMELVRLQGIYSRKVAIENGAPLIGVIPMGFASDNGILGPTGGGYV